MEPSVDEVIVERGWFVRLWLGAVVLIGLGLAIAAVGLGSFLPGRIVMVGPVDLVWVQALLVVATIWCCVAIVIGLMVKMAGGRWSRRIVHGLLVPVILLVGLASSVVAGGLVYLGYGVDPRYELDTQPGSPRYIASTFTFGETTLMLYRGDGHVFERLNLRMPAVDRSTSFEQSHRVETDADGRSFLVYPREGGGQARVLLPQD